LSHLKTESRRRNRRRRKRKRRKKRRKKKDEDEGGKVYVCDKRQLEPLPPSFLVRVLST
jgi:hypothetical protein